MESSRIRQVTYHENVQQGYASTFEVIAVTADGGERRLIWGLSKSEQAFFYVSELRSFLRLRDISL